MSKFLGVVLGSAAIVICFPIIFPLGIVHWLHRWAYLQITRSVQ